MERKEISRRFVQSKLFRELGSSTKVSENSDNGSVDILMKEEDWSGSMEKGKEGSMKSQKSAIALAEVAIKVGPSSNQTVDRNLPVTSQPSSRIKPSEGELKRHQDEQVVSPEEKDVICLHPSFAANGMTTPQKKRRASTSTPRKGRTGSTPRKEKKGSTTREENRSSTPNKRMKFFKRESGGIPFVLCTDAPPSKAIPDLRLEAQLAAEETSRMFAGRKTHPFFTSLKGVKSSQDLTNSESLVEKERGLAFYPIHICQNSEIQDEYGNLDWGYLIFCERSSVGDIDCKCSSVYEGTIGPLNLDCFVNGCHKFGRVSTDDEISFDECLEFHVQDSIQERVMSHYHASHSHPASSLWTDKYRPQNSKQICGNVESIKSISEWLQQWHRKDTSTSQFSMDNYDSDGDDPDHSYQQSDSDSYDAEDTLKNVLLVTGPVGSGKSAAIYACARDQGFHIIENNASDWRNGVLVKQKFGEAMESHWRHCVAGSAESLPSLSLSKAMEVVDVDSCSDNEVTELTASQKKDYPDTSLRHTIATGFENGPAYHQSETKAMILFEDVDACLSEDPGFISSIQQLAETAKRPIILTCNSENPILPKNLDRLHVRFTVPSREELLGLVQSICSAEKATIHPSTIERCVHSCQGDIRKTILFLQFWWQGLTLDIGKKPSSAYSPVPFDVDAGHQILPRVIPGGCPSPLSATVAVEVDKSLNRTVGTHDSLGVKPRTPYAQTDSSWDKMEASSSQVDSNFDLSDCSPIAFGRCSTRRKFFSVLSSDSEDDGSCDFKAEVLCMENGTAPDCLLSEVYEIPIEHITKSEADELEEYCLQLTGRRGSSYRRDPSISQHMPPLSAFPVISDMEIVQEAELHCAKMSSCTLISSQPKSLRILQNNQGTLENKCGTDIACVYEEENDDALSLSKSGLPREKECSNTDFMRRCRSLYSHAANERMDSAKETWKRLRDPFHNLKKHVTAGELATCQVLKLTHDLCNLISEADLLFMDCQALLSDSFESAGIHTEEIYDDGYGQLEMSSVVAEHAMCFYVKEIVSSSMPLTASKFPLNLASEMLSYSTSSIALGKLTSLDQTKVGRLGWKTIQSLSLSARSSSKSDNCMCNLLQTVVPLKSYLSSSKGHSFHEYISTLSQISRLETSRLINCMDNQKQRRARVSRHYLSSGSFTMSPGDISKLEEFNSYKRKLIIS